VPTYRHGRHENGQNFLQDQPTADHVVAHVAGTSGPIVEIGPGRGALTERLARLGRPLTVVEIDRGLAARLERQLGPEVAVVHGDFLRHPLPREPHVLVGNLPFHLTTAMLRHVLRAPGWTHAVLLVQWEVARRRAGVGGRTLMTAQWLPWFTFELGRRVPAGAFTPAPSVDGGLLIVARRPSPLIHVSQRQTFHAMAHRVFTGRGRGIVEITTRAGLFASEREARNWATAVGLAGRALPKDLTAEQWVDLFRRSGARRASANVSSTGRVSPSRAERGDRDPEGGVHPRGG
jgi:23S rRNA (adenine-N6)-dimethyltransferase